MTIKDLLSLKAQADHDLRIAEAASRRAGAKAKTARARFKTAKLAAKRAKRSAKAARKSARQATREADRLLAAVCEHRDKVAKLAKNAAGISTTTSPTTRRKKTRRSPVTRTRVSANPPTAAGPKSGGAHARRQSRTSPAIKVDTKVPQPAIANAATARTIARLGTPSSPDVAEVPTAVSVVAGQIPARGQSVESVTPVGSLKQ